VRWAKTAQLFDVIYVQFSRVGTNKKVPTKKPKFLADTREKTRRLKKQRSQVAGDTSSCCRPTKKQNKQGEKNTRTANTQPTAIKRPASNGLQFPTINLLGNQERTHTHTSPTVEIMPRKPEDNFVRRDFFFFR
jgi:hypothetical protein